MSLPNSFRVLAGLVLGFAAGPAWAALTITPITWNVIGLDSNNVNTGPDTFPVGARVCNVSGTASAPVTATFVRTGATNAFITMLTPGGTLTSGTLPAGGAPASQYTISTTPANCYDFYFEVQITRSTSAWNTTQGYYISATNGTETVTTPTTNRELYVEKLISQNRNGVDSFTGPSTVYVGQTVTYTVNGHTATGGYEQVEFAPVLPVLFQMTNVSVTMAVPTGSVNSAVYADACGWVNDTTSPNYFRANNSDECILADNYTGGKAGGDPVSLTYVVKAITAGSGTMTNVWYDFSGSSFHYNSDVGTGANSLPFTIVNASPITGTKSFSPATIGPGGGYTSTLTITLNNPNAAPSQDPAGIPGVSFTDLFPTSPGQMSIASPLTTSNTCGGTLSENDAIDGDTTLEIGDGSLRLTGGTIPWNGSCTISVLVTASTPGLYTNTIAAGGVTTNYAGTSSNAAAISGSLALVPGYKSVRVSTDADGSGTATVGDTLTWSVFYNNPNGSTAIAGFQVTDSVGANMTVTGTPVVSYTPAACSTGTANAAFNGGGATSLFTSAFTFNSNCTVRVDYTTTVGAAAAGTTLSNQASGSGTGLAAVLTDNIDTTTTGLPAGVTPTAGSVAQTQVAAISPTTVAIPTPPTVTKAFSSATIPVGGTSQVTLTLANANAGAITLTGAFTDTLPAGLVVATPNGLAGTCTLASVTAAAGGTTITYANGASIPASSSCTIQVNVLNTSDTDATITQAAGFYTNTVPAGDLDTTAGSNTVTTSATLAVVGGYKSVRVFTDADSSGLAAATVGDTLEWRVSYYNPPNGASPGTTIAAFQATDAIGANMTYVAGSLALAQSPAACHAGTVNASYNGGANTSLFTAGANFTAPATTGCTVTFTYRVTVDAAAPGSTLSNQASASGTGLSAVLTDNIDNTTTGQPANVTVTANSIAQTQLSGAISPTTAPVLLRPTISKSFSPDPILFGSSSTLTITLSNPNTTTALTAAAFTDLFPVTPGQMSVASPLSAATTCAGGTLSDNDAVDGDTTLEAGDGSVRLSGGAIPANGSCTVTIDVTVAAAGVYTNTIGAGALGTSGGTNAAATNDTLTVIAIPSIAVVKSSAAYSDPLNGLINPKRIPGALITYSITVTNSGDGSPDVDSTIVLDAIPAGTDLSVADFAGGGSGPVAFGDGTPTSALSYTFTSLASAADDVSFSNDGGATFTYTPVPNGDGVDPAVTHIRINAKGTFAADAVAGAPSPSFTVSFRVRIE